MNDCPLWIAIKLLKRAKRFRAHPKIIIQLENRVKEEAHKVNEILSRGWNLFELPNTGDRKWPKER